MATNYLNFIAKIPLVDEQITLSKEMCQDVLMTNMSFNAGDQNKLISPLM